MTVPAVPTLAELITMIEAKAEEGDLEKVKDLALDLIASLYWQSRAARVLTAHFAGEDVSGMNSPDMLEALVLLKDLADPQIVRGPGLLDQLCPEHGEKMELRRGIYIICPKCRAEGKAR